MLRDFPSGDISSYGNTPMIVLSKCLLNNDIKRYHSIFYFFESGFDSLSLYGTFTGT